MGTIAPIMGTETRPDDLSRLLFGSTRREVLALLFGRPDESFYLREIQRAAGGGSGAVQRELKQLVQAGLVERKARGRQVFFSANRDAVIFPELKAIIDKTAGVADIIRASLTPLIQKGELELAFIFGSVASGKQTTRSDVDLLVVGDALMVDVLTELRSAETRLGREINAVVYSVSEFRAKIASGLPFLKRVVAGPKVLLAGDERELKRLAR